jgi:4,4'-diaponeurosporenoate glycosyltransferase
LTEIELAWILRRIGSFRWWTVVAFPVPLAVFVGLYFRSLLLVRVRRRVAWRGRDIAIGREPA